MLINAKRTAHATILISARMQRHWGINLIVCHKGVTEVVGKSVVTKQKNDREFDDG